MFVLDYITPYLLFDNIVKYFDIGKSHSSEPADRVFNIALSVEACYFRYTDMKPPGRHKLYEPSQILCNK